MPADRTLIKPRLPRGLADRDAGAIRATEAMVAKIRAVYERYGFEPVETPLIEYTEALGKFLPDQDRPNEGVFSFQDDDEAWLSLRYDLTAPLARYVAENYDRLPKPYRSYRHGWVFRNEKPGPGRFRQFMQFDADTVGAASPAADAEMCMMMADTLEALGIPRGQYVVKVNSRKVLDGVMEAIGLGGDENAGRRLTVLRAIDKLDRLGIAGVYQLLGPGRTDESGDFTKGAGLEPSANNSIIQFVSALSFKANTHLLDPVVSELNLSESTKEKIGEFIDNSIKRSAGELAERTPSAAERLGLEPAQIERILSFVYQPRHYEEAGAEIGLFKSRDVPFVPDYQFNLNQWEKLVGETTVGSEGITELRMMGNIFQDAGYRDRVDISSEIVRGLEYYTGPIFEASLSLEVPNEKGQPVVFGSVGGGGRYDGLVGRFMKDNVPATGFSIGVSRLQAALTVLGKIDAATARGPVVVTVMDRARLADYQRYVTLLRNAGIAAELYLGESGMRAQLKYADRRNAPAVVIQGEDERARGVVQVKDLAVGKAAATAIAGHEQWKEERPGQVEVPEAELVAAVRKIVDG